jgi:peroxiredoxin
MADDSEAKHLVSGLAMPRIGLHSTQGGSVSLAQAPGLNVCFFYPWTGRPGLPNPPNWDDIPGAHGSTPEAEGFRDLYVEFRSLGASICGISLQETSFQQEFSERLQLPYPLLSDAGHDLQRVLKLPTFETGDVTYLKRLTLLISDGVLVSAFYPVLDPAGHPGDVLRAVRKMQEG